MRGDERGDPEQLTLGWGASANDGNWQINKHHGGVCLVALWMLSSPLWRVISIELTTGLTRTVNGVLNREVLVRGLFRVWWGC